MKLWFALVGAILLCLPGCTQSEPDASGASELADGRLRLSEEILARAGIEVVEIESRRLPRRLEVPGRLELNEDRTARVGSPTEGRVVEVRARLGQRLNRGAPMVAIHSHELIAARADQDKAQAELAAAEKGHRFALSESERAQRLFDAKALSLRDRQASEASLSAAEAVLERARSDLLRAERLLHHLGASADEPVADGDSEDGGDVWVRAPLSGTVLERNVTVGAVVNPSDTLAVISDLSSLWAVAEIPERQATEVREAMAVEVRVEAFDSEFPGTIFHISDSLDPSLRTVSVRARVPNEGAGLRAEMYATIVIDLGESEPTIAVPSAAMQQIDGQPIVFVALEEGLFEMRRVEAGVAVDGWVRIASGLDASERVVAEGSFLLKSELLRSSFEEE